MGNHKPRSADRQSSIAPAVCNDAAMSVPNPTHTRGPKSQPKYRRYDESELRVILRFLAAYLTEFQMILAQERELAKGVEKLPTFAGRVKYREHQVATVRELVKRAYWPQKHLELIPDAEIERLLLSCLQR